MMDVAKRAETTVATVSRVVNNIGYVSAALRERVNSAIAEIGYVPNANARALRTKRSRTIGVVVGDLMNPYSVELANTVTSAAVDYGYTTFIGAATDDTDSDVAVIDAFHRQRVDGLVVATLQTPSSDVALTKLAKHGMPIVLVGRDIDHAMMDSISADFRSGGRMAAQHLIDLGHKRIAFVGADFDEAERVIRLRGYLDALESAGIRIRSGYIVGNRQAAGSPRYSGHGMGYQATLQLIRLPVPPTAIFARNDHTALGVLQALKEANLNVPQDMSVIGFDDIPLADRVVPAVSSVSQPTKNQGQAAVECLLRRIEHPDEKTEPKKLVFDCTLVARETSARLQTSAKKTTTSRSKQKSRKSKTSGSTTKGTKQ
ncbi:MAG: LacI family DNA-binding transcriptional regulator [Myxococcota bacterium]